MQSTKRVHESIHQVFQRSRLVFWYDAEQKWESYFDTFQDESIKKIKVRNTEFGTKVTIHRDPNPDARYFLYFPYARPNDIENWLLDMLLQGHEYKADRGTLILLELGLPYEFLDFVNNHLGFFDSQKRFQALQAQLNASDDSASLRLKMMAAITGAAPDLDAICYWFLDKSADGFLLDPIEEHFSKSNLVDAYWKQIAVTFGYANENPSLRDFVTTLFRWDNPLESGVTLDPHARVFLQRWKDSQSFSASYRKWAMTLESELHIASKLDALEDVRVVEKSDTFAAIEKFTLYRICKTFEKGDADSAIPGLIQKRRNSFWFSDHEHGYEALEQAVILRDLIASAELKIENIDAGINRYMISWHKIDMAYRRCQYHLRKYGQVALTERINNWVEKAYVNNFLLPLADRWCDQVRGLSVWKSQKLPAQKDFFEIFVQPFLEKGQKVVVIVSDALRYEIAAEFATKLRAENRWDADLKAVLASLPSYTQLGMASLLPGDKREIQLPDGTVTIDGKSTKGTNARSQVLANYLDGRAIALQAEEFLEMNTKTESRALVRDHDVIFVFHNLIDKTGDSAVTEATTTDAVENAFDQIFQILRKAASSNSNNMLITSDHGFLFQQSTVDEDAALPNASEWLYRDRRFAIGLGIEESPAVKIFQPEGLGLEGNWSAAFAMGLGRFPLSGSGKRYVHGGLSLQEAIVPVLQIHKARTDNTERVDVDLMRVPAKITTGQVSLAMYQDQPIADKVLSRTLQVGVYAADNTSLSEVRTIVFDSADDEPRQREKNIVLTLSRAADEFNNQDVEIRLVETVAGTSQTTVYKTHRVKLQKPFASDFDDF